MKKCEEFIELIHAYIDNELVSQEIKQLESHLATCQGCQKKVEIFKVLKTTLKEKIVPVSAPVSLRERIVKRQIKLVSVSRILLFPRWAYALVSVIIVLGGIIFYQQRIKPSHFLIVRADTKIQEHIDNCPDCQKGAVKIIEGHIKIFSAKKFQLQKHLDECLDCQNKIVKMVKECMESMAWYISPKSFGTLSVLKMREKGITI